MPDVHLLFFLIKKVNKKIIPAFTHKALRLAAIYSGLRALLFPNFEIICFNFLPDNSDFLD